MKFCPSKFTSQKKHPKFSGNRAGMAVPVPISTCPQCSLLLHEGNPFWRYSLVQIQTPFTPMHTNTHTVKICGNLCSSGEQGSVRVKSRLESPFGKDSNSTRLEWESSSDSNRSCFESLLHFTWNWEDLQNIFFEVSIKRQVQMNKIKNNWGMKY